MKLERGKISHHLPDPLPDLLYLTDSSRTSVRYVAGRGCAESGLMQLSLSLSLTLATAGQSSWNMAIPVLSPLQGIDIYKSLLQLTPFPPSLNHRTIMERSSQCSLKVSPPLSTSSPPSPMSAPSRDPILATVTGWSPRSEL